MLLLSFRLIAFCAEVIIILRSRAEPWLTLVLENLIRIWRRSLIQWVIMGHVSLVIYKGVLGPIIGHSFTQLTLNSWSEHRVTSHDIDFRQIIFLIFVIFGILCYLSLESLILNKIGQNFGLNLILISYRWVIYLIISV